ncbi:MAG: RNA polymerase factor sigma-32 [Bdellovibrionales bacterium]|nr:RNA polymerase factor sigma-32 [Bdellovibrionales bacterium]
MKNEKHKSADQPAKKKTKSKKNLPSKVNALVVRDSLDQYLSEMGKIPLLSVEEEKRLSKLWFEERDREAGQKLVMSNLRFVVKIAKEYSKYGFKMSDLIQEGNLGLMHAVDKYDPSKGYRLITYAVWWIRAYIQAFVLRSWSIVRSGTTRAQRRIFGGLQKARKKIASMNSGQAISNKDLAQELEVSEEDLEQTLMLMSKRDMSLQQPVGKDQQLLFGETLSDEKENQEDRMIREDLSEKVRQAVDEIYDELKPRERYLLDYRLLSDQPMTLEAVGHEFGVSRERVRQLEERLKGKLKKALEATQENFESPS